MIKIVGFLSILFSLNVLNAQDLAYAKMLDSTLSSPEFGGRGYVDKGVQIAAKFIRTQYKNAGLQSFTKNYFQDFSFSINTIQKINDLSIVGNVLKAGSDYLISAASKSISGTYNLVYLPDSLYGNSEALGNFFHENLTDKFIVTEGRFRELKSMYDLPAKGIIFLSKTKLMWELSHAQKTRNFVVIDILDSKFLRDSKTITVNFKSKYYSKYKTQNVAAYITGKKYPDSFIVITAHYDHLGKMGKDIYFPGANDNASGTSMLLDLAKYYSNPNNQPDYSIAFIAFSGEEVGLLGSTFSAKNPLFPLSKIRFLVNLDMVGTGSKGITVVNATVFPQEFKILSDINLKNNFLADVKQRGESCNSDHCPFYSKGVPSFFIYTFGDEYSEYHNVMDKYKDLPFTEYNNFFKLMLEFLKSI